MPRYKDYNYNQTKLLPINFSEQILPGSFEHTLNGKKVTEGMALP